MIQHPDPGDLAIMIAANQKPEHIGKVVLVGAYLTGERLINRYGQPIMNDQHMRVYGDSLGTPAPAQCWSAPRRTLMKINPPQDHSFHEERTTQPLAAHHRPATA